MIAVGIPAGPINDVAQAFSDPQVEALGLVEHFSHPTLGDQRQVGNPLRMDGLREGSIRLPPPLLGQHTQEVLRDFGYAQGQITEWLQSGVAGQQETISSGR
jgi:crotonobetainyl-CoA:carnitine CoA-transferase CaiB-like acyl-CoA transferase